MSRGLGTDCSVLSEEELIFLLIQGYSSGDVYDARSMQISIAGPECKRLGLKFLLRRPSRKCGHRLKTRKGHCIQCNPAYIEFQERHSRAGWIYIAYSNKTKLFKIGFTDDISSREKTLNAEIYGGISDWYLYRHAQVSEGGKIERRLHQLLKAFLFEKNTTKSGKVIASREIFLCESESIEDAIYIVETEYTEVKFSWRMDEV